MTIPRRVPPGGRRRRQRLRRPRRRHPPAGGRHRRPPCSRPATSPAAAPTSTATSGFTFDGGPTVITAPHCLEELFEAAGRRCPTTSSSCRSRRSTAWSGPTATVRLRRRRRRMAQQIARRAPGRRRRLPALRRLQPPGVRDRLRGAGRDAVPALLRHGQGRARAGPAARRPLGLQHRRRFVRRRARCARRCRFTRCWSAATRSRPASIYTLIHYLERKWGVFFPRGGTGALVAGAGPAVRGAGRRAAAVVPGRAHRRRPARRAPAAPGHQPGRRRASRSTWWCPTPTCTTPTPGCTGASPPPRRAREGSSAWTGRCRCSCSTSAPTATTPAASPTTRWCSGRATRSCSATSSAARALPDDFSLYLHAPTVTDPSMAPPGCGVVLRAVAGAAPGPRAARLGQDRRRLRRPHPGRARAAPARPAPARGGAPAFTPATSSRELRSYHGSAFSCAPRLTQSAYFRPHNRDPHIPGLYLVGAGTHPGAGVPGVINSAKATARVIAEDFAADLATDLSRDPTLARSRAPDAPRADGVPA